MSIRRWRLRVATATLTAVAAGVFAATAAAAPPANTVLPTISGTPTVGQTLTATDGTWSNAPTSFAYQWLRCNGGGEKCANAPHRTQKKNTHPRADARSTKRHPGAAPNAGGAHARQSDKTA